MKRFYAQALKTGIASITFVNTLIVDRDILSMDDIKLLKKIVQNRQNSKQVRLAALYRLEKLGKKHISFFISLVNDKKLENELRALAGYALLRINTKEAITALRKHRAIYIGALATQAEHDKDKTAMGKMDYVMRSPKYTDREKLAAASALTTLGKKKGLGFLARSLGHKNPNVAAMASGSLMRLSWRSDVQKAVIAKLKAPDPDTRIIAIFTLSNAINNKVVRALAPKLSDKDKKVCITAAKAMGELAFRGTTSLESSEEAAGKLANNKLSKMYNKGGDARIIASIGLLAQEDKRATKGIMLGITHRSPYLRSTCAVAIPDLLKKRMITASKARKALLPLLKDPSEEVRIVATLALGYISKNRPGRLLKMRPKKKMD
jgi:HEAT repeat protein